MLTLKRLLFTLFMLSYTTLFAGAMGPVCTKYCPGTWDVGALALFLQPSFGGNNLGYASFNNPGPDLFNNVIMTNGASDYLTTVTPNWGWGFQIEGAYYVTSTNDLNISWYHLNHRTTRTFPPENLFGGSASALYAGRFQVHPTWDAINMETGQRFDFNPLQQMRINVGVAFGRIKNTFTNYPQLQPNSAPLFQTTDTISYNGFGPRFGGGFYYDLSNAFKRNVPPLTVYAKIAADLLVGTAKQSVAGYQNYDGNYFTTGNYVQSNKSVVIPELEAKLGMTYDYNSHIGTLGFDVGYLWMDYLQAIVSQVGAGIESSAISLSTTNNFNLNGLYFGAKWTA